MRFKSTIWLILLTFSVEALAAPGLGGDEMLKSIGARTQAEYLGSNRDSRMTIQVNLVGGVAAPGVYHFPDTTNLVDALTLAGGVTPNADLSKVHVRRLSATGGVKTFKYDLAEVVSDPLKAYPELNNRDVVLIEAQDTSFMNTLSTVAVILGILSSSLLIYVTVKKINE